MAPREHGLSLTSSPMEAVPHSVGHAAMPECHCRFLRQAFHMGIENIAGLRPTGSIASGPQVGSQPKLRGVATGMARQRERERERATVPEAKGNIANKLMLNPVYCVGPPP